MGFQYAEISLIAVWNKVGVLANTVGTVSAMVHNNTLALMDQREEQMKRDILGQLELSIIRTDMAIMQTSDPEEKRCLSDKIKILEAKRDFVAEECTRISSEITGLIQNPAQTAPAPLLTPSAPLGLLHKVLPPPSSSTSTSSDTQILTAPNVFPPKWLIPVRRSISTSEARSL